MARKFEKKKLIDFKRAMIKGYVDTKIARKTKTQTSACIYIPRKFANKELTVILIPKDPTEEINK